MSIPFDFTRFERPARPNNSFIAPQGFVSAATPDAASPQFDCPADELFERIFAEIEARADWKLVASDPKARQIAFIAVTRLLRFKDDVDILVLPAGEDDSASTLAVFSRSRIGYSDFGTNKKRVSALLAALNMP